MASRWHRPAGSDVWIMGVLNCTPDSFSDGGRFIRSSADTGSAVDVDAAVARGLQMVADGAAVIDVGGESTRPGAAPVSEAEELRRVVPVVAALAAAGCTVSIDTMKARVMAEAITAGAMLVNDVSALTHDPASLSVVAERGVDLCLMHMQGAPATMQQRPSYQDVVTEVGDYLARRVDACLAAGVAADAILLDPGIGFGKRLEDNLALIRGLGALKARFGMPLLLGVSRKSFLGLLTGAAVADREIETAVAGAIGIVHGADMLRVHDVALQRRAMQVAAALS